MANTRTPAHGRLRGWLSICGPEFGRVTDNDGYWFPGRWIAGVCLVFGPLFMLAGDVLRSPFHYFFPEQFAAFEQHPGLITAGYACFGFGNILLWPAVIALCRGIGAIRPVWAMWGGTLVILGLFARAFHSGTDQITLILAETQGTDTAATLVGDYYWAWGDMTWHPVRILAFAILIGWAVLAVAAWRARVLAPLGAVALGLMSVHMLGTLKGTEIPESFIATGGLTIALVPVGIRMLLSGPAPSRRAVAWTLGIAALVVLGMLYGPRG